MKGLVCSPLPNAPENVTCCPRDGAAAACAVNMSLKSVEGAGAGAEARLFPVEKNSSHVPIDDPDFGAASAAF